MSERESLFARRQCGHCGSIVPVRETEPPSGFVDWEPLDGPVLLARLEKALYALRMIQDGPADDTLDAGAWSAGVATSALAAMEEVGYPKPCLYPGFGADPYTMGMQLCDDDGIVRRGRHHQGVDYPCTGHAHLLGEHIACTSPAHRRWA